MLDVYIAVLAEWRFTGFVNFEPRPLEWIRKNLSNYSAKEITRLMHEHRNEIDQTKETREWHRDCYTHHYDFRFHIDGKRIYIETVLDYDEDDSTIRVVGIKPA